jgi:hypothetical protein
VLIATSPGKDGRNLLIVGLEEMNIIRLQDDQPIERPLDEVPGLEGWTLYILGPEDMARFVSQTGQGG